MIQDSLHRLVPRDGNGAARLDTSQRLLAVSRKVLARQRTVFAHALRFGAEQVPFNPHWVAWAKKTKASLASTIQNGP